jgi:hypothetical protein
VTIVSAGKVSVLKLAVFPAPSAIIPPLQLTLFVQLPPLGFVHVPFAAFAHTAPIHDQMASDIASGKRFFIVTTGQGTLSGSY